MDFENQAQMPRPYKGQCDQHGEFDGHISNIIGREFKTQCPECSRIRQKKEEASDHAQAAMMRSIRLREKFGKAAIPARFIDKEFDDYRAESDRQKRALSVCREYAENFRDHDRDGRCLMLMGKPGTGKTHLAAAIGNHLVRNTDYLAIFRTVSGVMQDIKSSFDSQTAYTEADIMRLLTGADLLILDEVGATKANEFEMATVFAVINGRYEDKRPTLIVSNLAPKELAAAIGERCVDRLREGGGIAVGFDWESKRGEL